MTLHDRIMALPLVEPYAGRDYEAAELRNHASEIAKEADELINWLHAHLEKIRQIAGDESSFDEAQTAINRIKIWKERAQ